MARSGDKPEKRKAIKKNLYMNRYLYLMLLPVVLNFIIFHYIPMGGILMAFENYNPFKGIFGSEWVGFDNFKKLFGSYYFWSLLSNTLRLSIKSILIGFPAPIIFALLLNEMRAKSFKKTVQTISYLPNFISLVVVVSLVKQFLSVDTGIINRVIEAWGGERISFLSDPNWFDTIYILSDLWQGVGFSAIIYISAISGIDQGLYDAAAVDGAGRIRKIWYVTLPSITPTISVMLILRLGSILNVGWQKIMLLQNGLTKDVSDVIQLFVYERGLQNADFGFATAVGLLQSLIGFILIIVSNKISKKFSDTGIF